MTSNFWWMVLLLEKCNGKRGRADKNIRQLLAWRLVLFHVRILISTWKFFSFKSGLGSPKNVEILILCWIFEVKTRYEPAGRILICILDAKTGFLGNALFGRIRILTFDYKLPKMSQKARKSSVLSKLDYIATLPGPKFRVWNDLKLVKIRIRPMGGPCVTLFLCFYEVFFETAWFDRFTILTFSISSFCFSSIKRYSDPQFCPEILAIPEGYLMTNLVSKF